MAEILALLQNIAPLFEKTTYRQMSQVIFGMLVVSGRITLLGLSRWTEKGGRFRTIQRFCYTVLSWPALHWMFFKESFLRSEDEYITAGDEVAVSKAGKETYGLDRFFAGLQQRIIPGLSFFVFSLVNIREERSYPMRVAQIVKSAEEKATSKAKAETKKEQKTGKKKKPGRPKGSKNKNKEEVVFTPELLRIKESLQSLLETIKGQISLKYVALDGRVCFYDSLYSRRLHRFRHTPIPRHVALLKGTAHRKAQEQGYSYWFYGHL
jgi:hypothetical protein